MRGHPTLQVNQEIPNPNPKTEGVHGLRLRLKRKVRTRFSASSLQLPTVLFVMSLRRSLSTTELAGCRVAAWSERVPDVVRTDCIRDVGTKHTS